jgi:pyrimidine operon attenuation protein/uracil phosphoribosyltransferase
MGINDVQRCEFATFGANILRMSSPRTLVLSQDQIAQKLHRMAYQIYEQHHLERELVMVAVARKGVELAAKLHPLLVDVSGIQVKLVHLAMDKQDVLGPMQLSEPVSLSGKAVILVDDVLNSGRTLMYAARFLLGEPVKRLTTVVLVDRQHRQFPIKADIVGLSLSTTLQNHISVEFTPAGEAVYLE